MKSLNDAGEMHFTMEGCQNSCGMALALLKATGRKGKVLLARLVEQNLD
jgi:hypothetical protein